MNNFRLHISYVNNDTINKFNLKENDTVSLFEANNINYNKDNINYLNNHYAELCLYYYIWKNQLKTDYISIGHHRRYINKINFERLDNNEVQVYPLYARILDETPYMFLLKDGVNEYITFMLYRYLIEKENLDVNTVKEVLFNKNYNLYYFNIIACKWDIFNDICNFIFGFLEYIMPYKDYTNETYINNFINDLQLSFSNLDYFYNQDKLLTNNGRVKSGDRIIGCIYELLLPIFIELKYKSFIEIDETKKLGVVLNDFNEKTIFDDVKKWISKNTFSGCMQFYFKTSQNKLNKLREFLSDTYGLCGSYIFIVDEFPENTIELKLNEYIDTETPYDELNINNIKTINT